LLFVLGAAQELPRRERFKEISCEQENGAENSHTEVEIMARAVLQPATHPRKEAKCFAYMGKNDHDETSSAEQN
jgi:hypothetical protein